MDEYKQKIPNNGVEREALRQKGQFWTPSWVAEAMVSYAVAGGTDSIFDPAVGAGAFLRVAKNISVQARLELGLLGTEIDPIALEEAERSGLNKDDLSNVQIRDFILDPPQRLFKAIVGNPPYIRHHRLPVSLKTKLKALANKLLGVSLDGRAGLHIYFLLRALDLLEENGRLAFIMPADTCEGVFASKLWEWVINNYCLDAVVTFAPEASPFPNVDTNPLIFLIRRSNPAHQFQWVRCKQPDTQELKIWMCDLTDKDYADLDIYHRDVSEALITGLSRKPNTESNHDPTLVDYATVLRGIATGANEFFFLTHAQAKQIGIPAEFLLPAVGRTRDIPEAEITQETLKNLDQVGRPTLLFAPDGRPLNMFPNSVKEYLLKGEKIGLNKRSLITQRKPWYKMEARRVPPFLFAYLGRRNARFIRNYAGVLPLTGFLCVYPKHNDISYLDKLWRVLNHEHTIRNLALVGKSYGAGAIKVEPRSLERLPIPGHVLEEVGLNGQPDIQRLFR